jgi:hypothetical protein
MGRPSEFTPEMADAICEQLAGGVSLRSICDSDEMPNRATVFRWLAAHTSFRDQYAHAREAQADALVDEIMDIADEEVTTVRRSKHQPSTSAEDDGDVEVVFDATAVARNRLRVDARKWMAAKLKPKVYSERVQQEVSGPGGGPITAAVTNMTAQEFAEVARSIAAGI